MPSVNGPILLVEDNPDDEELTVMALKGAGVHNEIRVARDGAEALEYLLGSERQPALESPALVILDLKLPKMNGFQVLEKARAVERLRRLPVVVLTSSDTDEDVVRSYDLGANSYVRKPVAFAAFATAVKQLGLYWLLLNESRRET
ncbi:MAG TPA: response regulator [Polyangia bacterium]|jgi:two-component system response regulator|nr:response regulator [Polyangia bacterium]